MSDGADNAAALLSEASLSMISKAVEGNFKPSMTVAAGLMTMALLMHFVIELAKIRRGDRPDYVKAVFVVGIHIAMLLQYQTFASTLLDIGGRLTKGGQINSDAVIATAAKTLTARFALHQLQTEQKTAETKLGEKASTGLIDNAVSAYNRLQNSYNDAVIKKLEESGMDGAANLAKTMQQAAQSPLVPSPASLLMASPSQLIDQAMEGLAQVLMSLAFILTSGVVLLLSMIQKTAIALVMAVGPVIITLSAFPGPTSGLLFSWMLTLFELQLWAFATAVLGSMMGARFSAIPVSVINSNASVAANLSHYAENIAYCFILSGAYLTIPILCGALLRGGGMGSVAGQIMGQATGFASGVISGRLGGATPGGDNGHDGSSSAGGAESSSSGRAGDDGAAPTTTSDAPGKTKGQHIAKQRYFANKNKERAE